MNKIDINWDIHIEYLFTKLNDGRMTKEEIKKYLKDSFKELEEKISYLRENVSFLKNKITKDVSMEKDNINEQLEDKVNEIISKRL